MPGKVNPVIPEVVSQVAFNIIGNDVTVTMAAEAGQLELNAFEPIIFYNLIIPLSEMCCKYLLPLILRKQPCFSDVCPDITFKEQRRTHDLLAHFCPLIVPDHSPAAILCFYKDHRYVLQTFALNRSLIKILKVDTNIRILFS